jgi:hypothetical protein
LLVCDDGLSPPQVAFLRGQTQGASLDRITLHEKGTGHRIARVGDKNIKTLHTTSRCAHHLMVITVEMKVRLGLCQRTADAVEGFQVVAQLPGTS